VVKPVLVLLPYYAIAYFATVVSALAQVAALKMRPDFDVLTHGNSETVVRVLCRITQLLQDTTELVLIVGAAWTAMRLKKRAISALQLRVMREGENEAPSLSRLMEGANTALDWVIWVIAGLTALTAYGVDPSPLLASLGASSLIIGLAAQSILSNIISGVALYTGSSFRVGDHVEFFNTGGGKVVEGYIQVIGPSRLVVRDDSGALIYINNSDAAKFVVRNLSQAVAVIP
jgi:small conductance mechanosensitive channel